VRDPENPGHYDTLRLSNQATDDEIKSQFKVFYASPDETTKKLAMEAKKILLDPDSRKKYNAKLEKEKSKDG